METQNRLERKKLKYGFALIYIISIVLMALIFTALWNMLGSPAPIASNDKSSAPSEEYELLKQDELLHDGLKKLQLLDDNYAMLLTDSADRKVLDSLNQLINNSETSFKNTLNSIERQKKTSGVLSNSVRLDSIISSFRLALNNRRSVGYIREALLGENVNVSEDKRELLKLKMELQSKDNRILALEDQIKTPKKDIPDDNISNNLDNQKEIESLQADIRKADEKNSGLLTLNNSLTKDNNRLTSQVNELKSNTAISEGQKKTERSRNDILQNKIDDLDAKLIFAKIDCNLSRADAKQIISNSRQRKDLLQESLNALNNLSHSSNLSVQKKAEEKLNQLKTIVATIRD